MAHLFVNFAKVARTSHLFLDYRKILQLKIIVTVLSFQTLTNASSHLVIYMLRVETFCKVILVNAIRVISEMAFATAQVIYCNLNLLCLPLVEVKI